MERTPLTPVKKNNGSVLVHLPVKSPQRGVKRALDLECKENMPEWPESVPSEVEPTLADVVTPTGKALRRNIQRGIRRCVAVPMDDIFEDHHKEDEHDPILTKSPQSLTKVLYERALKELKDESQDYGVTQEQVKAMLPAACQSVAASALKRTTELTVPSLPEQEKFKAVADYLNEPSFVLRFDPKNLLADDMGPSVVANKAAMDALTHLEKDAVYAHEITHGKHKDVEYRVAYSQAFGVLGKLEAYNKDFSEILFRTQEVFADLEPASRSTDLALGIARFRQNRLEIHGPGKPSTHPARDEWAKLDASMVELHAKHKEEKERLERITQASKFMRARLDELSGTSGLKK